MDLRETYEPYGGMDTVLRINFKSITGKIIATYLIVVICSTAVTTLCFQSILYQDLERRSAKGLAKQAHDIAQFLSRDASDMPIPLETRPRPSSVFLSGRPMESDYLVADAQGIITYSSNPNHFAVGARLANLLPEFDLNAPEEGTVKPHLSGAFLAMQAWIGNSEAPDGVVVTYAEISALQALNRDILLLLLKSLTIAMAIAIPVALLLSRYLIMPINSLREYAKSIAQRRFDVRLDIKTEDELADLAQTFNEMVVQLERYDLGMRRFFQNTSHELKTPLMSIQGYAEGIRDGIFAGGQAAQGLEVISQECQRLKDILDEMINITRVHYADSSYSLHPCNVAEVLTGLADSLKGYAAERAVTVQVESQSRLEVISDPEQLRRLFSNLLANAIRHARSRVVVTATTSLAADLLSVVITDDGPGFTAQDLENAFDYFYKGSSGSTGLGLSISRLIVEAHHGSIRINNSPAGGGMVEITLPYSTS